MNKHYMRCVSLLKFSWLGLILLLFSGVAQAVSYTFSAGFSSTFPTCSNGNWNQSGSTWTCNGSFTLNSGDTIQPTSSLTILANGGMTFNGSNMIGSSNNSVNLQTSWGNITTSGTSTIYGSVSGNSGNITLSSTTVNGAVNTLGTIKVSGGNITSDVSGRNGVTSTNNTVFGGSITATNGSVSLTGGSVAGAVTGQGVTTNGTNLGGGVNSENSSFSITGGTIAGTLTTSGGNTSWINNATMTSGSITMSNTNLSISNSTLGSGSSTVPISSNNQVNLSNSTTVYGNVTAGSWQDALSIDSSSQVYGVCSPSNGRCSALTTGSSNCIPLTTAAGPTPIMAGSGQLSTGDNSTINGNTINRNNGNNGNNCQNGNNGNNCQNGILTTGATTTANPTLPALVPSSFPSSSSNVTLTTSGTVAPGSYRTVNATGNPTVFSGGTYYIDTLNVSSSVELGAGSYYINNFNMNGSAITVTGVVQIYIGNNFQINGSNVAINYPNGSPGNAGNLLINLYSNAQIQMGDNSNNLFFAGLIYSPFSNSQVQLGGQGNGNCNGNNGNGNGNNCSSTVIAGAIISAGQVQLGDGTQLNYSSTIASQIASLACPASSSGFDHIEIDHTGVGLTCLAPSVTVKACANSACSSYYTGGASVTLSPGGAVVSTGSTGSTTGTVSQAIAGAATLSASTTTTMTGSPAVTCLNTVTNANTCAFTFESTGFVISVPNRDAGVNNSDVTIQALKATGSTCAAAFPSGVAQPVNFYSTYNNPGSGTKVVSVNSTPVSTSSSTPTMLSLTFNSTGSVTVPLSYPDVGQLTLNATGKALNGVAMASTGGAFVVKPGGFVLSNLQQTASPNLTNPAAANATGALFVKAGESFSATVTATTCVAGVANCVVASAVTPNFGNETVKESVTLSAALAAGLGLTNNPALSGTVGTFINGVATGSNFSWPEVGIITLTPSLQSGNYLGVAGNTTGTTSGNIGRFYPDHFDTAVVASTSAPMLCVTGVTCPISYNGMVYSGQPFSVTVTAMNLSDVATTNYNATSGFAKTVTLAPYSSLGGSSLLAGTVGTLGKTNETAFVSGAITEALENFTFTATPTLPTNIYIRATDTDTVSSQRATNPTTTSIEGGVAVVSGRTQVSNAYGSELLPLTMTATAQFYTAAGSWVTSTTDNLTSYNTATNLSLANMSGTLTAAQISAVNAGIVTMSGGISNFTLKAPGSGNTGSANISLTAPGYLPSLPGLATFGIYKANSSIIYMRENY